MKTKTLNFLMLLVASLLVFCAYHAASAQTAPADTAPIKIEGAKMAPVPFSHPTHVDKAKIACKTCHHKELAGKAYVSCVKCHMLKEAKDGAPTAKDAFHKQCQTCHKESVRKGVSAPVKCNECHKK
ncbi:MAG TPA: cytochrome c3 family protein [Syntrophorhabdaceae bacterium]|jgi:hypothetical protein